MTSTTTGEQPGSAAPDDYATITPWVIADDAAAFVRFAGDVFDAEERFPPVYADEEQTRIAHAEIQVGDSILMVFDRSAGWRPTPTFLNIYVADTDETHQRALAAGAAEVTPLSTNAWGDRGSRIRDPFGNLWWINTRIEEVPEAEIAARMEQQEYLDDLALAMTTLDDELKDRPDQTG